MDLDKLYDKLDKIDNRQSKLTEDLSKYMIQSENRLTKLETEVSNTKMVIKGIIASVLAVATSVITYFTKRFISET